MKILSPNINTIIDGHLITLKPISIKESNENYVSWLNDNQINQFLEVRNNQQTIEDIANYVNGLRSRSGCELFAIFTKQDNRHVGNIAISNFNLNSNYAEYGLLIGNIQLHKSGLAAEATILLLEYLFQYVNVHKVIAHSTADNQPASKLIEHLGFTQEGTLRKQFILSSGKIVDVYCYG